MFNPYYEYPLMRNQMLNPLMRRYINPTRNIANSSMLPKITKIIETTQKGINTYNQIAPIYKEIKPIVTKISSTTKSIYSFINNRFTNNPLKNNVVKDAIKDVIINETAPKNPFFM